jgi:hypothetical protein
MTQPMFKIANAPPMDIRGVNSALRERAAEIIKKALATNVVERCQSGDEFAQTIRASAVQFETMDFTL